MENEMKSYLTMEVNKKNYRLPIGTEVNEVSPSDTLAHVIRDIIGLTGTKVPCNKGECGGCTVIVNGEPTLSCSTLAIECDGCSITTIEGLSDAETGKLHPIQEAYLEVDAIQCGYCTPGMVMSTKALLDKNDNPTETEICNALAGNICRCTGYVKYIDGVKLGAKKIRKYKQLAEQEKKEEEDYE